MELEYYRKVGEITRKAREFGSTLVQEGRSLLECADKVEEYIKSSGARPAFPVNISINQVAAHYAPAPNDPNEFKYGDLVKLDVGAHLDGYIGDTAITIEVGTDRWKKLIQSSSSALDRAIGIVKDGIAVGKIGATIEGEVSRFGYKPIKNLSGHLLSRYELHAGMSVPNVAEAFSRRLQSSMAIAIEPFCTNGKGQVKSGKPGNIYMFRNERKNISAESEELLRKIREEFITLPFASRWCLEFHPRAEELLGELTRCGALYRYPVLIESGDGMVSQTEHTVFVKEDKCEVLT